MGVSLALLALFGAPSLQAQEPPQGTRSGFSLEQNYPNPFNPETRIAYDLPSLSDVKLTFYNVSGQEIAVLMDGIQPEGAGEVVWDGRNSHGESLPSGVYFYRIDARDAAGTGEAFTMTRRMLLLK